ncbi:HesB/YadR/YfhF family protein [Aneurinibacillus sp. Ricciae_BoGa-3]|uniref:HesB/YadR/YfhF family protein n=1 Tax=Aneurinibacillus sp. Ricciae_BoGa-3 TaxID=3022697 RepID=UPI0023421C10|nr:HesB/YadR/YfhF family protein [Aneurinibacillus sp. Ricciae_BoGa-3]WCK54420.1 HesB/YadR/YfhF family protein [Aneurinibacillus sp. Ricciae_BoGa-3]
MKISIKKTAMEWFKNELGATEGSSCRFFVRYGGCSTVQSGFSLGVSLEEPQVVGSSVHEEGILFFIEKEDLWYFDGNDLIVDYDDARDELNFEYEPSQEPKL